MNANGQRTFELASADESIPMNAIDREELNQLATKVIGAIYEVSNVLGVGPASDRSQSLSHRQLPETQGRLEADCA